MKYGLLKISLLITFLSLSSCFGGVEDPPEVNQCQFNGSPRAFYCENTVTHKREKRDLLDPRMKAAQAVSADDYRALMLYQDYLIEQAGKRCK